MAKLFLGLAIAVMLAAAVLGFLAKGNIDKLQSEYKGTKVSLEQTRTSQRKAETELKKKDEDLTAANSKVEQQTTQINGLKSKADEAEKALASAKAELSTTSGELAILRKKLEGKPGEKDASVDEIVAQLDQLKNDLTKAQTDAAEKSQMVETLTNSNRQKEDQLSVAQSEVNRYKQGFARNGLSGRVLAVNGDWGFVILSAGDKQGAATGSTMVVTRGGEAIGKVRITSVEPSSSVADILPGTFRKGVTIQPGDVAVYEGSRAKSTLSSPGPGAIPSLPQR